ncbi:MAG: NfeD family protein [Acidobacteriota bacterium]
MDWWLWILIGLGLLVAEVALVPGAVVLVFFGAAAILVGMLEAIGIVGPLWMQLVLFSVLSMVSLFSLRGPILRRMNASGQGGVADVDRIVGSTALVLEDIAPGGIGQAELRGSTWKAKNLGDRTLAVGERGMIEQVEGLTIFIR